MTTPVTGTGGATGATPSDQTYVTITQPDGATMRIPRSKATYDPESKTWVSNVTPEMTAQANQINRKYGMALDADDFMGLLVAQMRFQDPSKPADTTAMMQQTASMAMLERVNELSTNAEAMSKAVKDLTSSNDQLMAYYAGQRVEQRMSTAVGMIGANITYADPADASKTLAGLVESVRFSESGPILVVNGKDVPLGSVTSVTSPATASTTAPAPTTGTTGSAPSDGTTTAKDGTTGSTPTDSTDSTGTPGTPGTPA
ncbi:flagellar hook capping FlgD N-terminal domain-containing protein [Mobilicoccus pelagius]|uniref:Basal-body rod modification protein FlgD n=1 Tax=Mobilicoccus pelagius NBRC 104925 TaxID=1089455 RepID=H5UP77_9MICO|nr:flagellar hook capping FlgD N-terminal domain-containing protein [Mobilicoccus pelagius]GAB47535.1 flagellar hook capping protein [Mobilicoccus pelagius NBRC 104925]